MRHYIEAWKRYADFKGRSSRAAQWWPFFATPIIVLILGGISAGVFGTASDETGPLESIYMLAWLCPGIALGVRRLHDIGRSGWWSLIALTGIGVIVLIFWACRSGDTEVNAWGPPSDSTRSDKGKPHSRPPDYGAPAPDSPISQGWWDIGYNELISQQGEVFEGRGLTTRSGAQGSTFEPVATGSAATSDMADPRRSDRLHRAQRS